jgi:phosphoribosylformylglycinamidine cyclo-ligase
VPPLFGLIQRQGEVNPQEMYRVFNMGIGMLVIVAQEDADELRRSIPEETWLVGELTEGPQKVILD